jgi:predicted nucleotidyltransferase
MLRLLLDRARIEDFCRRWKVRELSLFGSVLRDDFGDESDVDVLVSFAPDARWGLLAHSRMEDDLANVVGRPVDVVTRASIERSGNWIRRREILETAVPYLVEGHVAG